MRLDGLEAAGPPADVTHLPEVLDCGNLVDRIRASVIGDDTVIDGPFAGEGRSRRSRTAGGCRGRRRKQPLPGEALAEVHARRGSPVATDH
jgi:hypothetical protein